MIYKLKLVLFICLSCLLSASTLDQSQLPLLNQTVPQIANNSLTGNLEQLNQTLINEVQKEIKDTVQPNLPAWVLEELKDYKKVKDFPAESQSFVFKMPPGKIYAFNWVPNQKLNELRFMINVFTANGGQQLSFIHNAEQQQFVKIESHNIPTQVYTFLGNVYVSKVFVVPFFTKQKTLKFTNNNPIQVIIQISLQGTPIIINQYQIAKNSHFQNAAEKLRSIQTQLVGLESSRTKKYKWEWGFLDREEHYQSQMLNLTLVELVVIVATAVVQMCCIKNLLDSTHIV